MTTARAVVILHRHLEQATRRADLSMAQYRLLLLLKDAPQRAGVLAKVSSLSKATISLAVNAARERGWVATAAGGDGRTTMVSLTPDGRTQLEAFEADLAKAIGLALRPQDLETLAETLTGAARAAKAQMDGEPHIPRDD